jgi:hypothetical protein
MQNMQDKLNGLMNCTAAAVVKGSFLEVAMVGVKTLDSHGGADRITHPVVLLLGGGFLARYGPVGSGLEALGDGVDVEIQVVGQEGTYVRVLIVSDQGPGILAR